LSNLGSNTVSTTGNVSGGYIFGNGSQLTGVAASYGNSNVAAYLPTYNGNILANVITVDILTAGTNISGANLRTEGVVSAQGNITTNVGSFFIGNGSQLTGIVSSYGNSNVTTLLSNLGSNTVSTTGNVSGGYIFGNGSQLTGVAASYGNSDVTTLLSNLGSNSISTTGNITAGNFVGNVVGTGAGTPTITSSTNLDLSAAAAVRVIGGGTFRLPNLTTEQIANVTAANGDMAYNTTTNKLQAYVNGAWGNVTVV
jgi:hypothetical protein